jgi:gliding motility associated protien GldN
MKHLFITCILVGSLFATGQVITPEDDGLTPKRELHAANARVIPYSFIRQDDIMWSTRQWERIQVQEKLNHPLYYPVKALPDRKSLFDVLKDAILTEGTISEVFVDDRFEMPLTTQEVADILFRVDTILDPDDPSIVLGIDSIEIKSPDLRYWEIKSDWYFDKKRGEMKNRIIGISPVVEDPSTREIYPTFWIWFPDARQAMSTHVAYNPSNNTRRMTFDQIFQMRYFNAVVYKENNVYDRGIKDYKNGRPLDQLLESRRIREELRNYEHDLWQF